MSDPTSIPPVRATPKANAVEKAADHHFPCEQCGADLRFTPGATELTCPFCGHAQAIPDTVDREDALREIDYNSMLKGQVAASEFVETKVMVCPSCGAQTDMHEATQAARCPFCDTPVVTDTGAHRFIKRGLILPAEHAVLDHQQVHVGGQQAAVGVLRGADNRLAADIEAGVDDHAAAGLFFEFPHQPVETAVPLLVHGLDAGAHVHMGDRRQGGTGHIHSFQQVRTLHELALLISQRQPLVLLHGCHDEHVGRLAVEIKIG